MMKNLVLVGVLLCLVWRAQAHVGSPNVFFEGNAGPYRTHVVVRPAEVIPGLAEISVRIDNGEVSRVTALPMKWNTGRNGAPPPDIAKRVRGETNLFTAQLWFMEQGTHSIEIGIQGDHGTGTVIVPVNAGASRVLRMPHALGGLLAGLGLLLLLLLVSIIGAAARESVLDPGTVVSSGRVWRGRGIMASATVLLVLLLWGGKHWWQAEAADYRNNLLYRPVRMQASVQAAGSKRTLRLEIPDFGRAAAPLVPDHGKLMHLFMVREPSLDAFAHLHPVKLEKKTFAADLPDLPGGTYQLYADITYETGWSDTLTNRIEVPTMTAEAASGPAIARRADEDDAWCISATQHDLSEGEYSPSAGLIVRMVGPNHLEPNRSEHLEFAVRDEQGHTVQLEPYLGMTGHLVVMRHDGAVFTHLHPGGSASMAAMQLSTLRAEGKLPLRAAFGKEDPICELPKAGAVELAWINGTGERQGTVAFPYAFPKEGKYRLWLQVRVKGQIQTAVFDVEVREPGKGRNVRA